MTTIFQVHYPLIDPSNLSTSYPDGKPLVNLIELLSFFWRGGGRGGGYSLKAIWLVLSSWEPEKCTCWFNNSTSVMMLSGIFLLLLFSFPSCIPLLFLTQTMSILIGFVQLGVYYFISYPRYQIGGVELPEFPANTI